MREYRHSGLLGWAVGATIGTAVVVLLLVLTIATLSKGGPLPVDLLVLLAIVTLVLVPALWAMAVIASTKLVVTEDGWVERRRRFARTLRIPISEIRRVERWSEGDELSKSLITIWYGHSGRLEWWAGEQALEDLIARIQAVNPHVAVSGHW